MFFFGISKKVALFSLLVHFRQAFFARHGGEGGGGLSNHTLPLLLSALPFAFAPPPPPGEWIEGGEGEGSKKLKIDAENYDSEAAEYTTTYRGVRSERRGQGSSLSLFFAKPPLLSLQHLTARTIDEGRKDSPPCCMCACVAEALQFPEFASGNFLRTKGRRNMWLCIVRNQTRGEGEGYTKRDKNMNVDAAPHNTNKREVFANTYRVFC